MPRIFEALILIHRSIKITHTYTHAHNNGRRKGEEIEGEEEEISEEKY